MKSADTNNTSSFWKRNAFRIFFLIGIFVIYPIYLVWEVSGVQKLCDSLPQGTSTTEMRSIIVQYGWHWYRVLDHEVEGEPDMKATYVFASATMGDAVCRIYHNSSGVVEATTGYREKSAQKASADNEDIGTAEATLEESESKLTSNKVGPLIHSSGLLTRHCSPQMYDSLAPHINAERKLAWLKLAVPIVQNRLGVPKNDAVQVAYLLLNESVRLGLDTNLVAALLDHAPDAGQKKDKGLIGALPLNKEVYAQLRKQAIENGVDADCLINSSGNVRISMALLSALRDFRENNLELALQDYATFGMKLSRAEANKFPGQIKLKWQALRQQ